jgi:hypothetical protein
MAGPDSLRSRIPDLDSEELRLLFAESRRFSFTLYRALCIDATERLVAADTTECALDCEKAWRKLGLGLGLRFFAGLSRVKPPSRVRRRAARLPPSNLESEECFWVSGSKDSACDSVIQLEHGIPCLSQREHGSSPSHYIYLQQLDHKRAAQIQTYQYTLGYTAITCVASFKGRGIAQIMTVIRAP